MVVLKGGCYLLITLKVKVVVNISLLGDVNKRNQNFERTLDR